MAQLVCLAERSDPTLEVGEGVARPTDAAEVVVVSDQHGEDCLLRWEDDGGAVVA
jgi:hypothetical protein